MRWNKLPRLKHAESWDNVGLLVGDPQQKLTRVLLTIDYTPAVANEARENGFYAVVAYHPPVFDAVKRVTSSGATELVFDAICCGVGIYSPQYCAGCCARRNQ